MELMKWDPFRLMREFLRDPFAEMMGVGREEREIEYFVPRFDVRETKESFVLEADLPGVKEEDLEVTLLGRRLTVRGKRERSKEEGETYYTCERDYGHFTRSFTLPEGIDADNVKAELKDGVLRIWVGKKPEVQPKKIALGKRKEIKA